MNMNVHEPRLHKLEFILGARCIVPASTQCDIAAGSDCLLYKAYFHVERPVKVIALP